MKDRKYSFSLFVIGMFSITQVNLIGSISIAEIFIFLAAPFVFLQDYQVLKKDGFVPIITLSLALIVGMLISSYINHSQFAFMLRGFATTYSIFAAIVVMHRLLRVNPSGLKWYLLGYAISGVISIFVFQTSVESALYSEGQKGLAASGGILSSPTFIVGRVLPFVSLPSRGWYLATPLPYSIFACGLCSILPLFVSISGRSAALSAACSLALICIGRKSLLTMQSIPKRFGSVVIILLISAIIFKVGYSTAAKKGYLGTEASAKYEKQTTTGTDILHLLMAGRTDSFVGLLACSKKPIIGYGPWAIDYDGVYEEFLSKYGSYEDYMEYLELQTYYRKTLGTSRYGLIPAHSCIVGFWLWYGIIGLLFWLYILKLILDLLRKHISAIPQWFGYFAFTCPGTLWNIFFSPYGGRVLIPTFIVTLLIARGVSLGKMRLPYHMLCEIEDTKRR